MQKARCWTACLANIYYCTTLYCTTLYDWVYCKMQRHTDKGYDGFYSILFFINLLYSTPFNSTLSYSTLLYFTLFRFVLFCSIHFYPVPFYSIHQFNSTLLYTKLCTIYYMPYDAMLCYAIQYYAVLYDAMLCDAMLHHTMLCYTIRYYTMLCYAMLCKIGTAIYLSKHLVKSPLGAPRWFVRPRKKCRERQTEREREKKERQGERVCVWERERKSAKKLASVIDK